jgi:hypothetical protein
VHMDLDDGANNSSKPSESNDKNSRGSQNYDKPEGSRQDNGNSSGGKHGNVPSKERAGAPVDGQVVADNDFILITSIKLLILL